MALAYNRKKVLNTYVAYVTLQKYIKLISERKTK